MTDTDLPPLDLSLLAKVTPDTMQDAAPELPPHEASDSSELPPPRNTGAGQRRSGGARARRRPGASQERSEDAGHDPVQYRPGILVKPLSELYTSVGTLVLPFNQPVGTAFIQNAQQCAEALDNAARQDPHIRKMLMALITTSVWGQVIAAHMPILMAMAVTMVPSVRESVAVMNRPGPPGQEPDQESETVNPVSRGNGRVPR